MMKRIVIAGLIALFAVGGIWAQDPFDGFDDFQQSFQAFGEGVAGALPHNTTIGQQWADAHIGQLLGVPPRFGIGVSTGFTTIPEDVFLESVAGLGLTAEDFGEYSEYIGKIGLPIPGYTIDARVGGIILPFDVGLKIGYLDSNAAEGDEIALDYLTVGADVRYRVLREGLLLPKVSIGLGVTQSNMRFGLPGVFGENITIGSVPNPTEGDPENESTLSFSDPDLFLQWESTVFDLTAQASKRFLIFQPFVGAGISYGSSNVGGGLSSEIEIDGQPMTDEDAQNIQAALDALGQGDFNFDGQEFGFLAAQDGQVNTRLYGGLGLRLFMFNLDLGASYEFGSGSLGAQIGARVQL